VHVLNMNVPQVCFLFKKYSTWTLYY